MKKYIQRIKDSINKSWNNKTSKTKRLIIYGLLLAYSGFALYVIFSPTPDYGYEDIYLWKNHLLYIPLPHHKNH